MAPNIASITAPKKDIGKKLILTTPNGADKVLVHTCCAPCSSAILECLLYNNITPTVFYFNPNIYPLEEYLHRKEESKRYTRELGIEFVDADYDYSKWREEMVGMECEPERGGRCLKCFTLRLVETARYASMHGFSLITTTLASSRWKSLEQINAAGSYATTLYPDVFYWEQNWRKGGLSERRSTIIKEMNFYNQQYCGCEFSRR